jgi:hypothetical protein
VGVEHWRGKSYEDAHLQALYKNNMLLDGGWLVKCTPIPLGCAAHHLTTWLEFSPTSTPNVGGIMFVHSLHIQQRTWNYGNHPSWENAHVVENHQVPAIGFYILPCSLPPCGFSFRTCHFLLAPSKLFCKVCIRDFMHVILMFLLFFHLCFLIFFLPLKMRMCDIELYHHIMFPLVI